MIDKFGVATWSSPTWCERATTWLDERLADASIERTGEVTQPRVRPWAMVLTAPTTAGRVWFKAFGPLTAFEVAVYELLRGAAPARVLAPLATDVERGWMILPDGGASLGERMTGADLWEAMAAVLPQYGQLQRDLEHRVDDLVAAAVPDMRPHVLPERFQTAVEAAHAYVDRHGSPDDREKLRRVEGLQAQFDEECARLQALPGGASLDHNDLHPWNVIPGTAGLTDVKFYDWGDAVVAHPLISALIPLRMQQQELGVGNRDPAVLRSRDAYLEAFSDLAPHGELVDALELSCHLGKVVRALTWQRAIQDGDDEYADAPWFWLASLLDESYLGEA